MEGTLKELSMFGQEEQKFEVTAPSDCFKNEEPSGAAAALRNVGSHFDRLGTQLVPTLAPWRCYVVPWSAEHVGGRSGQSR